MPKASNLAGMRFGKLIVTERAGTSSGNATWYCLCDCGKKTVVTACNLKHGGTVSCGCHRDTNVSSINKTHGKSNTDEYHCWLHMHARCSNRESSDYPNYGGRGIKVCERWLLFEAFLADMGERPSRRHSIDRINNDGDYGPGNCRWATREQQGNNKRSNRKLSCNGVELTLSQWATRTGISRGAIKQRLKRGWSVERSLTEKV